MRRTNHSMDLDGALSMRNAGEHNFSEIARSGNQNPATIPYAAGDNGMFGGEGLATLDNKTMMTLGIGALIGFLIWKST